MSAKPYFDEEVEAARAHLATVSQLDAKSGDTIAVCRDIERRWLATVDALKARLAAAEARAERAVGLLGDARKCVSLVNVNGYYDVWLARCYALLKEVSHGQQG